MLGEQAVLPTPKAILEPYAASWARAPSYVQERLQAFDRKLVCRYDPDEHLWRVFARRVFATFQCHLDGTPLLHYEDDFIPVFTLGEPPHGAHPQEGIDDCLRYLSHQRWLKLLDRIDRDAQAIAKHKQDEWAEVQSIYEAAGQEAADLLLYDPKMRSRMAEAFPETGLGARVSVSR